MAATTMGLHGLELARLLTLRSSNSYRDDWFCEVSSREVDWAELVEEDSASYLLYLLVVSS